jgi:S-formylglutathione hydrolase
MATADDRDPLMDLATVAEHGCFGGTVGYYRHASRVTGCEMQFSVFVPPTARAGRVPVLWWLSGLTCTAENFTTKAGAYRAAAECGLMIVAPDTSPRGADVPDDDAYDLGQGAGFYVDATQAPWSRHFRMYSYVTAELPELVAGRFPADGNRQGISGHSMGGHGALTLGLRHPDRYRSLSAFAPIAAPTQCPWGRRAFAAYLGADESAWSGHDATALMGAVADRHAAAEILVDQGADDQFLEAQLMPERFAAACAAAGQRLSLRMQPGYDHSYFFVASFIDDHIRHHARILAAA